MLFCALFRTLFIIYFVVAMYKFFPSTYPPTPLFSNDNSETPREDDDVEANGYERQNKTTTQTAAAAQQQRAKYVHVHLLVEFFVVFHSFWDISKIMFHISFSVNMHYRRLSTVCTRVHRTRTELSFCVSYPSSPKSWYFSLAWQNMPTSVCAYVRVRKRVPLHGAARAPTCRRTPELVDS